MKINCLHQNKIPRLLPTVSLLAFALVAAQGQSPTPQLPSAIEKDLLALDLKWSEAASAKDLDKVVSYYADNALVMPSNAAAATTKEAIRATWKDLLASPGAAVSWKPIKVEAAYSGDLAYVTGTYKVTMNDASGKPTTDKGKYVEIYKRQADGGWKAIIDIWNSDLPATPAKKK